jgi:hypothetical protein
MKLLISRFLTLALFLGSLAAWGAHAQHPTIAFTAPSSFIARESAFPAGAYTLRQTQGDPNLWQIFSDTKSCDSMLIAEPVDFLARSNKTEVTFRKYGNTMVLKQIATAGNDAGYVVQTSYAEKNAAKAGTPTKVSVPAQKK